MARSFSSARRRLLSSVLAIVVTSSMLALATPAEAKAKVAPKISVKASATTVTAGESTTITGKVSKVKARQKVVLVRKNGRKWATVKTIRTAKSGTFKYAFRPPAGAQTYRVQLKATSKLKAARSKSFRVAVLTPGTVTASVSPAELEVGQSVAVMGSARPFRAGAPVELQRSSGGSWATVATSAVTAGGSFSIPHTPAAGVWSYRVVKPRDGLHAAATSSSVTTDAAGPASLIIDIIGLPSNNPAAVTVTGPTGSQSVASSKTITNAARGAWTVTATDVTVGSDGYYATAPSQTVTVSRGQSQVVTVDYGIVVPETTEVLSGAQVTDLVQGPDGTAELTVASSASADVSTGDVVAAGVGPSTPTGLLGKVTAVDGNQVTVDTTGVTLLDAVDAGTFDVSMPLTNDDVVDPGELADGDVEPLRMGDRRAQAVKQVADDSSVKRKLKKNLTCKNGGSASATAEFEFAPTIKFSADWDLFQGVTKAQLTAGISQTSQVKATIEGAASCELKSTPLLATSATFRPITFTVGPVPVVLVPSLQYYLSGTANAEGSAEAGVRQSFTADAGLRYAKNAGFSPVQSIDSKASLIGPSFAGHAEAEVGVAPQLTVLLYGIGGPRVYIRGSVEADAQAAANVQAASLDWNVDLRMRGAAAFDVEALGLHSGDLEIFNRKWDVANGRLGYTPPPPAVITTASLPDATVGTAYSQQLTTADNRPGAWSISAGTLPAGLKVSGDRILGTPTAAATRTFTVRFKPAGAAVTKSFTISVAPGEGEAGAGWTSVNSGDFGHTCGIRAGELYCWGLNSAGRLGVGDTTNRTTPTRVGDASDWVMVDAGFTHTCGIRESAQLYCWGSNIQGQLGTGDPGAPGTEQKTVPTLVGTAADWTNVTIGRDRTCGVRAAGELYCWGWNPDGTLGTGDTTNRDVPTRVGADSDWATVAAGDTHICGTRTSGELYCWGNGAFGQLGTGDTAFRPLPTRVVTGTDWTDVTSGSYQTCGLRGGSALYCWGANWQGALGVGDEVDRLTPTAVEPAVGWLNITSAGGGTCGLQLGGELYCWGSSYDGGGGTSHESPTRVGEDSGWTNVSAGSAYTCAVRGGDVYCWGYNTYGQLGVGDTADRFAPTKVVGP